MKKFYLFSFIVYSFFAFSQAPNQISYQGVARNTSGTVISNQPIGVKFDIHQGTASGTVVFSETHTGLTTNSFGLFTTYIGSINNLSVINWANGPYFVEVSIDPNTGTYSSLGTQQLMSVPYALYAASAPAPSVSFTNNVLSVGGNTATINSGTTYTAGNGIDITGGIISNTATAVTPTIVGTGATTVTGTYPNLTVNTPTVSILGAGNATVTGAFPNYTVNVPPSGSSLPNALSGQFLYNTGTVWDTLPRNNLYFDGSNFGIGTISPQATFHVNGDGKFNSSVTTPQIYTNNFQMTATLPNGKVLTSDASGNGTWQDIPAPTLNYNNGTNVLSLTQGTAVSTTTIVGSGSNTVNIVGSGLATVTPTTGSTFTVSVPTPTIIGTGVASINNTAPNYTVNVPMSTYNNNTGVFTTGTQSISVAPTLTLVGNVLRSGPATNSVTIPAAPLSYVSSTTQGILQSGPPTNTVSIPNYTLTNTSNTITLSNGSANSSVIIPPTPLVLSGSTLTAGPLTNSVNLATLPGLWSTVSATNIATTNSLSLVGIGTNSPTYKLDVYSTGVTPATIHGYNSGATVSSTGVFGENPNNGIGVYGQSNTGAGVWGKSTTGAGVYGESTSGDGGKFILSSNTTTANAVNAQTNGTGAALFAKSYNVNSLAAKFEGLTWMNGKLRLDSTLTMTGYTAANPPALSPLNEGRMFFDKGTNKFKVSENGGVYVDLIPATGSFPWQQGTGIIIQTNLSDKVGIGTATPASKLEVVTNGSLIDGLRITNTSTTTNGPGFYLDGNNQDWTITGTNAGSGAGANKFVIRDFTNSTDRFIIDNSGKIGMGITNPSAALHVRNNASALDGLNLEIANSGNGNNGLQLTHSGTGNAAYFQINNTSSNAKIIDAVSNGNGIGISAVITNSASTADLVNATQYGRGNAGFFQIINANNPAKGIEVSTNGNGAALGASTTGLSNAGIFSISNNVNNSAAIFANTNGSGNAIYASNSSSTTATVHFENTGNYDATRAVSAGGRAIYAQSNSSGYATAEFNNMNSGYSINAYKSGTATGIAANFANYNTANNGDVVYVSGNGAGALIHAVSSNTNTGTAGWFEGNVNVDGNVSIPITKNYKYNTPKTDYYSVSALDLNTEGTYQRGAIAGGVYILNGSAGTQGNLYAGVKLPNNATVTAVDAYVKDGDGTLDFSYAQLWRQDATVGTSNGSPIIMAQTNGTTGSSTTIVKVSDTSVTNSVIDNSLYAYYLRVGTYQSNPNIIIYKIVITYAISNVD